MAPACNPDLSDCDPSFDRLCYGSNEGTSKQSLRHPAWPTLRFTMPSKAGGSPSTYLNLISESAVLFFHQLE
ncbi:peptidase m61 domain-containing protein [Colletotrichum asianum]